MRRTALIALTAALLVALAAPASAHPAQPVNPTLPADLTHAATDNVEYLGRFPEHAGTAGGRLVDDRFYLTDPRGVFVYDVSEPASPRLLGSLPLPQTGTGVALAQEDPDTDGNILLVDALVRSAPTNGATSGRLHVVDVSQPDDLRVLSIVDVSDHTWTCVSALVDGELNNCAYAYGRTGHIVDLTDPADAKLHPASWRTAVRYGAGKANSPYTHDLTEIRPGLVMTAGAEAVLMDTSDPTNPVRLTSIKRAKPWSTFGYHSVEWADAGRDRYVVLGTEIAPPTVPGTPPNTAGSDCKGEESVIEVWDATEILAALRAYEAGTPAEAAFAGARFNRTDAFDAGGRGLFLEGQSPGHVLFCAHWMDLHPGFAAGGLMTVSYYDRGTRFVRVSEDGTMKEIGWIVAAEGYSGSSRWISDDVVYIMDYRRGMEVVRVTDQPATGVRRAAPTAGRVGGAYVPWSPAPVAALSAVGLALWGLVLRGSRARARSVGR